MHQLSINLDRFFLTISGPTRDSSEFLSMSEGAGQIDPVLNICLLFETGKVAALALLAAFLKSDEV